MLLEKSSRLHSFNDGFSFAHNDKCTRLHIILNPMADDSSIPAILSPNHEAGKKSSNKRRRFRHCRSAPPIACVLNKEKAADSFPGSKLFFNKFKLSNKLVIVIVLMYLALGSTCFYLVRNQVKGKKTTPVLDSVYFVVVTMTTVGYGDLVPNSVASKLLACALVFSGMAIIALLLSKAADYLVEKQELLLVRAINMNENANDAKILKEAEMKKSRYKFFMTMATLLVLVGCGTIFLVKVEKLSLVDAFYCVCCTVTTLGYGDVSFEKEGGRVFAVFWILLGTVCLAQFFLYLAEVCTEHRQRQLVKWVLTRRMSFLDIEAADLDHDGTVSPAEFVIFKLKEMGKIKQEDIAILMQEFEKIDVDQSGAISAADVLAQPTI